jgi:hypothetical protein
MSNLVVTNEMGNIVFDSNREECFYHLSQTQGGWYAFVQALDIGMPHARLTKPMKVRYWGTFNTNNKAESILDILHYGNKWPDLNFKKGNNHE